MKNVKILIATHKKAKMPDDAMYLPIHVGAEGKEPIGYQCDNTGEHISHLNSQFCELCALYWGWKNLDADYWGLAHYRRHFMGKRKSKDPFERIITQPEVDALLDQADIIVTKKRRYYIETIYSHYIHTLHAEPLDTTRDVIAKMHPEYLSAFDECMQHTYMHAFNMCIMRRDLLDEYCQWLFGILFEVTDRLKDRQYSAFHARYPGRLSELLLDVWLEHKGYRYKEVPFVYTEQIKKFKKAFHFLKAKFFKVKYEGSF